MEFSEAQFQAATQKISSGLVDLSMRIQQIRPAAEEAVGQIFVTGAVKDAILLLADQMVWLAESVLDKIVEVLEGVAAPVLFFKYAFDWTDIKGIATDVAGQLTPEAMTGTQAWHGEAADAYRKQIKPQGDAAARVGTVAGEISMALTICAAAGLLFYVAIGVILVKFIIAVIAVIAALGSVVFSWAGVALAVEEAAVNPGLIIAAITALVGALTAQAGQLVALHGEAVDNSVFPGGKWPDPVTGNYSDASVKDGNAKWSLG